MNKNKTRTNRVLLRGRFVSILVAGVILGTVGMTLFMLLTTDVGVLLDISAIDGWYSQVNDSMSSFWYNIFGTVSPFFDHLMSNSLVYMCGLFLVLIFMLAFFLSWKKKKGKKDNNKSYYKKK
jgi:predicted membrane protein